MKQIVKALIVVAIVIVLFLASTLLLIDRALPVPDPITTDQLDAAHRDGMIEGCTEMFLSIAGPPPSNSHMLALVQACVEFANGADLPMFSPVVPQDVPLPTVSPGSWM